MLVGLAIVYGMLCLVALIWDQKNDTNKFSAIKLCSYFALIEVFILVWFAVVPGSIPRRIFSVLPEEFRKIEFVHTAYSMSIFLYISILIGLFISKTSYLNKSATVVWEKTKNSSFADIWKVSELNKEFYAKSLVFGLTLYAFFLYILILRGLQSDFGNRSEISFGLGSIQFLFTFLINISGAFFYSYFYNKGKYYLSIILCLFLLLVLGSLTQRTPVGIFIFLLVLTHHYTCSKINIISWKSFFVVIASLLFMFTAVQFRPSYGCLSLGEKIERDIIMRLGVLERQVAVLGYFSKREYWGTGVYESLVYAPLPSVLYKEKPPIDTGMYIRMISLGHEIYPPVASRKLDRTSWPDGFLVGYTSFGWPGLFLLGVFSGIFLGFIYTGLESKFDLFSLFLFANLTFLGAKPLDPYNIVSVSSYCGIFLFISACYTWNKDNSDCKTVVKESLRT